MLALGGALKAIFLDFFHGKPLCICNRISYWNSEGASGKENLRTTQNKYVGRIYNCIGTPTDPKCLIY